MIQKSDFKVVSHFVSELFFLFFRSEDKINSDYYDIFFFLRTSIPEVFYI